MATILYVEDDLGLRKKTKESLEEAGHRVEAFAFCDDALEALNGEKKYDVMLTDYQLEPGDDARTGVDLIRAAKERRPTLPVILTSSDTLENIREKEGRELPVDNIVSKKDVSYDLSIKSAVTKALMATMSQINQSKGSGPGALGDET